MARLARLLLAAVGGMAATLIFYLFLFFLQVQNADNACESYPQTVPGADFQDVRGIGFENSFLNPGGRCTYQMDDGSTVVTREPGWWFSGSIVGLVAAFAGAFAGAVVVAARRTGHAGVLFGLATLVAPSLGAARRFSRPRVGRREVRGRADPLR